MIELINSLSNLPGKTLEKLEISYIARIVSYDKEKMTAKMTPLLSAIPQEGERVDSQDIESVRVDCIPEIRHIFQPGDLVKCIQSASPISDPIENGRPANILSLRLSTTYVTITGKIHPGDFTPPTHYSNESGLIIGDDPKNYMAIRGDRFYDKGLRELDGKIEVAGNSREVMTHPESDAALQSMVGTINAELVKIAAAINAIVPGSYVPGTISLDLSSAKTDNIKTGAG